jgi:hypothetical protein
MWYVVLIKEKLKTNKKSSIKKTSYQAKKVVSATKKKESS